MLSVILLSFYYFKYHYDECHYAECYNSDCHYAESHYSDSVVITGPVYQKNIMNCIVVTKQNIIVPILIVTETFSMVVYFCARLCNAFTIPG
jgi:hypothetical protein